RLAAAVVACPCAPLDRVGCGALVASAPPPMKAQDQALVTDGQFNFGRFDAPFASINPLDAQPYRVPLPAIARSFRLKEWQAFQFGDERYFANVALFNAKALALVQVKLFDRHTHTKHLFEKQVPPWAFRAPDQLLDSSMAYD